MITHNPTGKLISGHVLDVNQDAFDSALRFYDPRLYTRWNPKKVRGWGCWEIRVKPVSKSAVYQGTHAGTSYYKVMSLEIDSVHHVLDCAFLNYDALRRIKEMDTFNTPNWVDQFEAKEEAERAAAKAAATEELKYAMKQNRSAVRDLYEAVRSGVNPARLLTTDTKWVY